MSSGQDTAHQQNLLNHAPNGHASDTFDHVVPKETSETAPRSRPGGWLAPAGIWLLELGAAIFSLIAIASIIVLLAVSNGQRLSEWHVVSPNAVLSFLAALVQLTSSVVLAETFSQLKWLHFRQAHPLSHLQLFDDASKGVFGAVRLVFIKHRTYVIVILAALVSVAMLLLEPFIQLTITYPTVPIEIAGSHSTFRQVESFRNLAPNFQAELDAVGEGTVLVDPVLQSQIFNAIFNLPQAPKVACANGNCTWPDITTLGACSQCRNLEIGPVRSDTPSTNLGTSIVNRICTEVTPGNTNDVTNNLDLHTRQCVFQFPNSNVDSPEALYGTQQLGRLAQSEIQTPWYTVWNSSAAYDKQGAFGVQENGLNATMIFLNLVKLPTVDPAVLPQNNRFIPDPLQATQCTIDLCLRTYKNISSTNGNVTYQQGDSVPLLFAGTSPTADNSSVLWLNLSTASGEVLPAGLTGPLRIDSDSFNALAFYLSNLFSVSFDSFGVSYRAQRYRDSFVMNPAQFLNMTDDFSALLTRVSDGITEGFRTGTNDGGQSVERQGVSTNTEAVIKVHWAYLALPIVCIVAALLLLICVIVLTHTSHIIAWKSSATALLFHDMSSWDSARHQVKSEKDAKRDAKHMVGYVAAQDGRLTLVNSKTAAKTRIPG